MFLESNSRFYSVVPVANVNRFRNRFIQQMPLLIEESFNVVHDVEVYPGSQGNHVSMLYNCLIGLLLLR